MAALHIRLRGVFSISSDDGENLTPKSKKAVGLIALIAASDTKVRNRRWLEDKLWSDRGPDQARGSLRTTLTEIRKSLRSAAGLLGSNRTSVWLDQAATITDLDDTSPTREFLEGLDIADPEFNDWLLRQRLKYEPTRTRDQAATGIPRRIAIQCGSHWSAKGHENVLSQIVDDQIGKIVSEFIASSHCSIHETKADLVIRTRVCEEASGSAVLVQVIDPEKDEIVHSDHCFTDNLGEFVRNQESLGRFCWNVADVTLDKLPELRAEHSPIAVRSRFVREALRNVLSFDATQMGESISILDTASKHLDFGLFLALKAWAMTSMIMEGFLVEDAATLGEIRALLRRSQEISPDDSMVCAVTANVESILFEDYNNSMVLARRALRENANNLFALQALSVGRAAQGQLEMAYELSKHCKTVSTLSKFEAMCNLHHSLLCMSIRRPDEALSSSQLAVDYSPNYRAPKRQLIALYALQSKSDQALLHINDLKAIEPEFSVERFLFDRRYPSNTLRKSGYLAKAAAALAGEN